MTKKEDTEAKPSQRPRPGRVLAIARHTFREAIRKKVLATAIIFSVAVALSAWFLPAHNYSDKIKLVASICLGTSAFFVTIVAIVIAATSVPKDIEQKLVYTVLTKPVSRSAFLWGKVLGHLLVISFILGIMWIVSIGVMRATVARGNVMVTVIAPGGPAEASGLREGDIVLAYNGVRLNGLAALSAAVEETRPGETIKLRVDKDGADRDLVITALPGDSAGAGLSSYVLGKLGFDATETKLVADRDVKPASLVFEGIEGGSVFPAENKVWMADGGYGPNSVVVKFSNLHGKSLRQGDIRVAVELDIFTSHVGKYVDDVTVSVLNPQTGEEEFFQHRLKGRTPSVLSLPRKYLSEDGSLQLRFVREAPNVLFTVDRMSSFRVLLAPRSFELNLLRSFFVLFLQMVVVVTIASLGSTFLSGPVAMFLSFGVYICGSVMDFVHLVAEKLKAGTLRVPGHTHGPIDMSQYGKQWYDDIAYRLAQVYMTVFPDFRRFQTVESLVGGKVIPWGFVGMALVYALVYSGICLAIGTLIFRRREVE